MPARRRAGGGAVTMLGSGSAPESRFLGRTAPKRARVVSGATPAEMALVALSEAQFQRIVRADLERRGYVVWVVPMMKLTTAGLPDVLAWHPARPGVLLAWELKRERDFRVTPKQRAAIDHLATVDGIDARIVRPSDWRALSEEV
jgi:hypothetical protein